MSAEDRASTRTADESGYTVQTAAADQHRAENDDQGQAATSSVANGTKQR